MKFHKRRHRLENLIARDSGIFRIRNTELEEFAQKRAREIKKQLDPHFTDAPQHRDSWNEYWAELPSGISTFGENLHWSYGWKDPVAHAAEAWKNSPEHWANETNKKFSNIGVGITRLILDGDEDNPLAWRWYFVTLFSDTPSE